MSEMGFLLILGCMSLGESLQGSYFIFVCTAAKPGKLQWVSSSVTLEVNRASWCAIQYCDNVYFIPRWTNTIKGWLLIVLTPFEIVSEYIVCAKLAVCA